MCPIIYGIHPVEEALKSSRLQIQKILISAQTPHPPLQSILDLANKKKIPVTLTHKEILERMTKGGVHQNVVGLIQETPYADVRSILSYWKKKGTMRNMQDLKDAIYHGAVKRIRPKVMTVATIIMGLLPIMWSAGTGSDVMKRIAAPMVGGVVTSAIMELAVYPAIYLLWKGRKFKRDNLLLFPEDDLDKFDNRQCDYLKSDHPKAYLRSSPVKPGLPDRLLCYP